MSVPGLRCRCEESHFLSFQVAILDFFSRVSRCVRSVCPHKPENSLVFFNNRSESKCCSISQMPLFSIFSLLFCNYISDARFVGQHFLIRGSENLAFSNFVLPHADYQCSQWIGKTELNVPSITKICNIENKLQLHCWFEPKLLKVCPSIFCMCVRSPPTALCMNNVSILCTDILCLHYINGGRNVVFFSSRCRDAVNIKSGLEHLVSSI